MVKNEGEPGGGPFWVDDPEGTDVPSLQIIEESQIDRNDPRQREIWSSATHFNPVDLVCGVRDFRGGKFALTRFADPALSIITRKSEQGRELLALERPGLWNGSMAFWNYALRRGAAGDLQSRENRFGSPAAAAPPLDGRQTLR